MQLWEDVRYALRQFARTPGFTTTAILTLALGIGATTAIFTLVHAVLLKSLPVANPDELYRIGDVENCCVNGGLQEDWSLFSWDKYKTFRDHTIGFSDMAAMQAGHSLIGVRRTSSNQPSASYVGSMSRATSSLPSGFPLTPAACSHRPTIRKAPLPLP